jgi:hypothetical protein
MVRLSKHQQPLVTDKAWKEKSKVGLRKGQGNHIPYQKDGMSKRRTYTDIRQLCHRLRSRTSRQGIPVDIHHRILRGVKRLRMIIGRRQ